MYSVVKILDKCNNYNLYIDQDGDGAVDTVLPPTVSNSPPANFDLLYPSDGDTTSTLEPTLSWSSTFDLNGDTVFYRVYIDTDSAFLSSDSSEILTDTTWEVALLDSVTYYWKVKAFDNKGGQTWCNQPYWTFTIATVLGVENHVVNKPKSFAFSQNYPNPFSSLTAISYSLPGSADGGQFKDLRYRWKACVYTCEQKARARTLRS